MKMLYISEYYGEKGQGAYQLTRAQIKSFRDILGDSNVDIVSIKLDHAIPEDETLFLSDGTTMIDKIINLTHGFPVFYSKRCEDAVINLINKNNYDLIYIGNSYFGATAKRIKKTYPNIPLWVFYHGVKANSGRQTIKEVNYRLTIVLRCMANYFGEKMTVKYCDTQLLLNERDSKELEKYYHRKADVLLPIYYTDTAVIYNIERTDEFRILFLGSSFWPNIHGITWFMKNVMPDVKEGVKLYVVGRGMECLRQKFEFHSSRVEVVGETDDLDYWYNSADVVVGPIFHGEGMKTKTAEALMYGKRYLGTREALCGYIGMDKYLCESAQDFISAINNYVENGVSRFNPKMRELYEKYYSVEAANKILIKELKKLEAYNG